MKKLFTRNIFYILTLVILGACANVSAPTGGPKDLQAPKIVKQTPENGTRNFRDKQIRIWFDEYVHVQGLNDQFISSPPLKKTPKYILKGKSVVFTILDTLLENTTYNLNFGNSVKDITENNEYKNLHIAFSTGNSIDSLKISGNVIYAEDLKPAEDVLILLYDTSYFYDSIPYFELPSYIGKTDKNGNFTVDYIKKGSYRLFALLDKNKNRIYDQPEEYIGFLDTIITPKVITKISTDTIFNDSLQVDSIITDTSYIYIPDSIKLSIFKEDKKIQYLSDYKRDMGQRFMFVFNDKTDSIDVKGINIDLGKTITEPSITHDTIYIWLTDSNIFKNDTLLISLKYLATDSLNKLSSKTDTLKMIYRKINKPKHNKYKKLKKNKKDKINIDFNIKNNGDLDLNKKLTFTSNEPLFKIDDTKINLYKYIDTNLVKIKFKLLKDSVLPRRYIVDFKKQENTKYQLSLDSACLHSYSGKTNTEIKHSFKIKDITQYGVLKLTIDSLNSPAVIQLRNAKGNVLQEKTVKTKGVVIFDFLNPGMYSLSLFFDDDQNKKWTTGNYLKKKQAEKIIFKNPGFKIRENWDLELNWNPYK